MKKRKAVRFNKIVYVHNHPPTLLVDKEDSNVTEPAMYTDYINAVKLEMHKYDKLTLPTMHTEYMNVTELAMHTDGKVTPPAMHTEGGDVTKPAMHTEDSNVTGPAIPTEDGTVTGPAVPTEDGTVTEPAVPTEDGNVTGPAVPTEDGNVTGPAVPTEDGTVTGPAAPTEDGNVTGPAVPTEDGDVTKVALHLAQSAIDTAVETVEEGYTIKNIKWLTHGEFTPEKCRQQIEEFVRTWEYQERLVCYAKLIETRDVVHSIHYIYYVRWSLPTAQRPMIPQSAYAFFTIKFNKNKPPDAPIDVSYSFEGQSLLHRPGMAHFPENCLIYVIEAKNKLAKPFISEINHA